MAVDETLPVLLVVPGRIDLCLETVDEECEIDPRPKPTAVVVLCYETIVPRNEIWYDDKAVRA